MTFLDDLVEKAKVGQLAILVGRDVESTASGRPSNKDLALGLAGEFGEAVSASLADVSERLQPWQYGPYLENTLPDGKTPGPLYRALVSLPVPYLMTAAYDDSLEQALDGAGRPFNSLASDADFSKRRFNRTDVLRLSGRLPDRNSLVVTGRHHQELLLEAGRTKLYGRVSDWLTNKTTLILGCDPAQDSDFERWLWREVLQFRGKFSGGAILIWPNPDHADADRWAARGGNVTLVDGQPLNVLDGLAGLLAEETISLPADPEMEKLRGLVQMLSGRPAAEELPVAPPAAEVTAKLGELPASDRIRWIRVSFELKVEAGEVQVRFSTVYEPDIGLGHAGEYRPTGLTLAKLSEWEEAAAKLRRQWKRPDETDVETTARRFMAALLPAAQPDSPAAKDRRMFGYALRDRQSFADDLFVVLDFPEKLDGLSSFPWELLHAGEINWEGVVDGRGFLGLEYPIYRRVGLVTSPGRATGRLGKALVVAADPTGQLTNLDQEADQVGGALTGAGLAVDVIKSDDPLVSTPADLVTRIRQGGYHLFHFAGHGLFDEDDPPASQLVLGQMGEPGLFLTAADLAAVARDSDLSLVFLNACYLADEDQIDPARPWEEGGMVDGLVRNGVPAAVGMRWKMGDDNASKLIKRFYEELLRGQPIERALMWARQDLRQEADWVNPVLTKRHGVLSTGL
jgi:hypothetical protein